MEDPYAVGDPYSAEIPFHSTNHHDESISNPQRRRRRRKRRRAEDEEHEEDEEDERSLGQMFPNSSRFGIERSNFVLGNMNVHPSVSAIQDLRGAALDAPQLANCGLQSMENPMDVHSESGSYCSQLCRQGRGFPLYTPGPRGNLPQEYQRQGVAIGDVGRVTSDGIFDFFFNIYLSSDDPINAIGTPEKFSPLTPRYNPADVTPLEYCADDYVSTPSSVQRLDLQPSESEFQNFAFECSGRQGAVLAIPLGSHGEKLDNLEDMVQYARQNAEYWYKYVNGTRGRRLANGSLYLVTGWEKTRAWGMAAFHDHTTESPFRLAFEQTRSGDMGATHQKYRWTASGPARTKTFGAIPVDEVPLNQTIFITGFSISLGGSIWGKLFKDVEISQIVDSRLGRYSKDYVPYGSQGSFSFPWSFGLSGGSGYAGGKQCTGQLNDGSLHDVTISELCPTKDLFHPSRVINDFILRKFPEADVAMSHDDDWRDIFRNDNGVFFQDAIALLRSACQLFVLIERNGLATVERLKNKDQATGALKTQSVMVDDAQCLAEEGVSAHRESPSPPTATVKEGSSRDRLSGSIDRRSAITVMVEEDQTCTSLTQCPVDMEVSEGRAMEDLATRTSPETGISSQTVPSRYPPSNDKDWNAPAEGLFLFPPSDWDSPIFDRVMKPLSPGPTAPSRRNSRTTSPFRSRSSSILRDNIGDNVRTLRHSPLPSWDCFASSSGSSAFPLEIKAEPEDTTLPPQPIRAVATSAVVRASQARRKNPSKPGNFICQLCGRDFTAKHNWRNHMNAHQDIKSFVCTKCGAKFGTSHVLKRHSSKCDGGTLARTSRSVSANV